MAICVVYLKPNGTTDPITVDAAQINTLPKDRPIEYCFIYGDELVVVKKKFPQFVKKPDELTLWIFSNDTKFILENW